MFLDKKKVLAQLRAAFRLRLPTRRKPLPGDSQAAPPAPSPRAPSLARAPAPPPMLTSPGQTSPAAALRPTPRPAAAQPGSNSSISGRQTVRSHSIAGPPPAPPPSPGPPSQPPWPTPASPAAAGSFGLAENRFRRAPRAGWPEAQSPQVLPAPVASRHGGEPPASPLAQHPGADARPSTLDLRPATPAQPLPSTTRPARRQPSTPISAADLSPRALAGLLERQAAALAAAASALASQEQALAAQHALLLALSANQQRLRRQLEAHAQRLDTWARSSLTP